MDFGRFRGFRGLGGRGLERVERGLEGLGWQRGFSCLEVLGGFFRLQRAHLEVHGCVVSMVFSRVDVGH